MKIKLLRGGSWFHIPDYCRSADRYRYAAGDDDFDDIGFRVVINTLPQSQPIPRSSDLETT